MANYWVGDAAGRVLGPLTLQALRELTGAGRLRGAVRASRDNETWIPLQELEEIKDLLAAAKGTPSLEQQQAERLKVQLRGLRALQTPHEVFGVKPQASLEELRAAFFRMAKRFSPDHLAPTTHPELRKVSEEIFSFLSQRMRDAEALSARGVPARPPPVLGQASSQPPAHTPPSLTPVPLRPAHTPPSLTPVPLRPAPAPPSLTPVPLRPGPAAPGPSTPPARAAQSAWRSVVPQHSAPSYAAEEFVGLVKRPDDKVQADIRVTPRNVGMFMDHPLINLATGGVFIPSEKPLRLGTSVELTLRFEEPARAIALRSSVIWESAVEDGRQQRGYGLRLSELRQEDRAFLQDFVRTHRRP